MCIQVGLLLQIRESVYGKGLGSAEEAQTMLDVSFYTCEPKPKQ